MNPPATIEILENGSMIKITDVDEYGIGPHGELEVINRENERVFMAADKTWVSVQVVKEAETA